MSLIDALGWLGSALLVWSMVQSSTARLREINLVACAILAAYNWSNRHGRWQCSTYVS